MRGWRWKGRATSQRRLWEGGWTAAVARAGAARTAPCEFAEGKTSQGWQQAPRLSLLGPHAAAPPARAAAPRLWLRLRGSRACLAAAAAAPTAPPRRHRQLPAGVQRHTQREVDALKPHRPNQRLWQLLGPLALQKVSQVHGQAGGHAAHLYVWFGDWVGPEQIGMDWVGPDGLHSAFAPAPWMGQAQPTCPIRPEHPRSPAHHPHYVPRRLAAADVNVHLDVPSGWFWFGGGNAESD